MPVPALGANVVTTRSDVERGHPAYYQDMAERMARETPGAFWINQFANPANPMAHETATGPEIWEQTDGTIDVLVVGAGDRVAVGIEALSIGHVMERAGVDIGLGDVIDTGIEPGLTNVELAVCVGVAIVDTRNGLSWDDCHIGIGYDQPGDGDVAVVEHREVIRDGLIHLSERVAVLIYKGSVLLHQINRRVLGNQNVLVVGVGTGSTANCFIDALAESGVRPSVSVASSDLSAGSSGKSTPSAWL
mgnify:CR=1 FL=1